MLALDRHQPPALALGGKPDAVARRVDRQAFEQGIEVQQHAAGPGLSNHGRVDLQPVRLAFDGDLQDSSVGLTDQVKVTGLVTGDAFEVQLTTADIGRRPVARLQPPRQTALRYRRRDEGQRLGTPHGILLIEPVNAVVVTVGNAP
ncbi:hypothetical protein D3C80_1729140 [compost metagenome]